jgi:hypothetical protein
MQFSLLLLQEDEGCEGGTASLVAAKSQLPSNRSVNFIKLYVLYYCLFLDLLLFLNLPLLIQLLLLLHLPLLLDLRLVLIYLSSFNSFSSHISRSSWISVSS